jgi:hypothetical protein
MAKNSRPAGAAQLDFIAFLDGGDRKVAVAERDAAALKETLTRPALTWLQ